MGKPHSQFFFSQEINTGTNKEAKIPSINKTVLSPKVSFFLQCSKMQIIPLKKFNIKTCFIQFLWFFRLQCWFKGQIISRIHLSLPNAYKLLCFDRNINGNRDVKFFEWDYWSLHWRKNLNLIHQKFQTIFNLKVHTWQLLFVGLI
jgi:hypothetical protein